ncbi:hypothetical protein [Roseomonas sp. HF4]|uniref:hypothetical protein n=1 Tax=Roseomonas sp. HF4 TaxID=2562313 RepID=UPI0010BFE8BF|nr:hypothetical protein [Roseomonas sp. HF4]
MSDDQGETRLRRRLVVLRVAVVGTAATALGGCVLVPAAPVRPAQVRTGISDADPSDGPGMGRGGGRRTGISDADPSDGPGMGRGGGRRSGINDADPSDGPGMGRGSGGRRTGINDADPSDGPGRGRGR